MMTYDQEEPTSHAWADHPQAGLRATSCCLQVRNSRRCAAISRSPNRRGIVGSPSSAPFRGASLSPSTEPSDWAFALARLRTNDLDEYLVPRRDVEVTVALLHETGRGVAYTKSPFAYLFELVP